MATLSRSVRLGQADLGKERHICAFFEGAEDAASVLVPFVVEALDRGERVIHLVGSRTGYLRRLSSEVDVSAAVESGQLDVRSWQTSYISNGRFSGSRMLTYVRRTLRESRSLGFPATRLIGDMEWARDRLPGAEELLPYESGLDAILARPHPTVVCATTCSATAAVASPGSWPLIAPPSWAASSNAHREPTQSPRGSGSWRPPQCCSRRMALREPALTR